jgi:hypothetical protein
MGAHPLKEHLRAHRVTSRSVVLDLRSRFSNCAALLRAASSVFAMQRNNLPPCGVFTGISKTRFLLN